MSLETEPILSTPPAELEARGSFMHKKSPVTSFGCTACGKCVVVPVEHIGTPQHLDDLRLADKYGNRIGICEDVIIGSGAIDLAEKPASIPLPPPTGFRPDMNHFPLV